MSKKTRYSRTTKYRAKILHTDKWVYGHYYPTIQDNNVIHMITEIEEIEKEGNQPSMLVNPTYEIDSLTLGRCTEISDECGNVMYEGDIIGTKTPNAHIEFGETVIVDNEGYSNNRVVGFYLSSLNNQDQFHMDEYFVGKVFGNIYDDLYLLPWENIPAEPVNVVTEDMAKDAGDPTLEGQEY